MNGSRTIALRLGATAVGGGVFGGVVAAWAIGRADTFTVIDLAVLAIPLVLVPALAHHVPGMAPERTVACGVLLVPAFAWAPGLPAALLAVPWVASTLAGAADALRRRWGRGAAEAVPAVYLAVAAGALVASRAGMTFGHIAEPIVELTTVHYGFAGAGATTLALLARRVAVPSRRRLADAGLVAVAGSAPVVALGFFTRHPLFQVGGAVTLTAGILATAVVTELDGARAARAPATRRLLRVAAVAPVAPMMLAIAWAAAQHWPVPALGIDAMVRTHGLANAVGFVGCGLAGYRRLLEAEVEARRSADTGGRSADTGGRSADTGGRRTDCTVDAPTQAANRTQPC